MRSPQPIDFTGSRALFVSGIWQGRGCKHAVYGISGCFDNFLLGVNISVLDRDGLQGFTRTRARCARVMYVCLKTCGVALCRSMVRLMRCHMRMKVFSAIGVFLPPTRYLKIFYSHQLSRWICSLKLSPMKILQPLRLQGFTYVRPTGFEPATFRGGALRESECLYNYLGVSDITSRCCRTEAWKNNVPPGT